VVILVQALVLALGFDHRFFASQSGLLSISVSEIVAYVVLAVMAMEALRGIRWRVPLQRGLSGPLGLTMRLYLIWVIVAAATCWLFFSNADGLHSLKDSMPALILFGATRLWVRSPDDLRRIANGVGSTLVLLSLLAISQYIFGGPHLNPLQDNSYDKFAISGEGRVAEPVVGTFASPNSFAVFFAPLFILCLTARAELGGGKLEWMALGLMAVALVLTQAKLVLGVTAITGACALALCTLRVRPNRSISAGILVGALSVLSLAVVYLMLHETDLPKGLTMGTMRGRLGLAAEGIHVLGRFSDVAWFGGGVELYRELLPISFHVHNEYLAQALMWGLPGAVLFSVILVRACWAGRNILWTTKLPVIAASLILLVESAGGTQRQGMLFLVLGLSMIEFAYPGHPGPTPSMPT
jgi:hypothetical protein